MSIWSSIISFFSKDIVKSFLKKFGEILVMFLGEIGRELKKVALEEVHKAEQTGKSGLEKYELAYRGVKKRFPELREKFIEAAIANAVLAIDPKV